MVVAPAVGKDRERLRGQLDGALVVATVVMGLGQIACTKDAQLQVSAAPGDLQGTDSSHERVVELAEIVQNSRDESRDTTPAGLVAKPFRERLGLAQAQERLPGFAKFSQLGPQLEPDLEGLLQRGLALRQRLEDGQRLLKAGPCVLGRRSHSRFATCLAKISHRLFMLLAAKGVVGESFHVLSEPVGVETLQRLDDARVERAPPRLEEAAVGHFVRQRVLERVLELREEARLVDEL